jgi:hypothetical protein
MHVLADDSRILITGASSGIGAALARRLAGGNRRIILVARRTERLESLANELNCPRDNVHIISADLTAPDGCARIIDEAVAQAGRIDVLVNNAGVGEYGEFVSRELAPLEKMIELNLTSLVRLTHLSLPGMVEQGRGHIVNIASTAAFQPTPSMAVYGATKSFVLSFSMALWHELKPAGIAVTCVCPGPVETEFFDHGGFDRRRDHFLRRAMSAEAVADATATAIESGRPLRIPGAINKLGTFATRLFPITRVTKIAAKLLGSK